MWLVDALNRVLMIVQPVQDLALAVLSHGAFPECVVPTGRRTHKFATVTAVLSHVFTILATVTIKRDINKRVVVPHKFVRLPFEFAAIALAANGARHD